MRPFDQVDGEKQSVSEATDCRQVLLLFTHISGVARHTIIACLATPRLVDIANECSQSGGRFAQLLMLLILTSVLLSSASVVVGRCRLTGQKRLLAVAVKGECSALIKLETDYCPSLCRRLIGSEPCSCHLMLDYRAPAACPLAKRWRVYCSL